MRLLRDSIRGWMRTPGTALIASGGLALALAAVTSFFSIVDHLVLRVLPVDRPGELFVLADEARAERYRYVSHHVWRELQARPALYASAFAWMAERVDIAPSGQSQEVEAVWATGEAFTTLGVAMALGRPFAAADDAPGAPNGPVAVISHDFWRRHYGGTSDVLDRALTINGVAVAVVGVAAPTFTGFEVGSRFDVALPTAVEPLVNRDFNFTSPFRTGLRVLLRLRPGTTAAAAAQAFRVEQQAIRLATLPNFRRPQEAADYLKSPWVLSPAADGASDVTTYYESAVFVAMALAGVVLLAACGNLALVLVAHGARRHSELVTRLAVGASRWHVVGQVVVDAGVLCTAGVVAGLALATWVTPVVVDAMGAIGFALDVEGGIDGRAATVAASAALLTAVLASVLPVIAATRVDLSSALRASTPRVSAGSRSESLLVAVQEAFSLVVVSIGALFVLSYRTLMATPTGVVGDDVVVAQLRLERLAPTHEQLVSMMSRAREFAARVPGAVAATTMTVPFERMFANTIIDVPGAAARPEPDRMVQMNWVSPRYFDVMGIRMIAGRPIADGDRAGTPRVAIANRRFVEKYFGGDLSVPKSIVFPDDDGTREAVDIVGIADDVVYKTLKEPALPGLHLAEAQQPDLTVPASRASVVLRLHDTSPASVQDVAAALAAALPEVTFSLQPFSWYVDREAARERVLAMIAVAFVIEGALLAAVGVLGVASGAAATRRRELGVRLALGALPRQITMLMASRNMRPVGAGLLAGALISWWTARLTASLLVASTPRGPHVFAAAAAALGGMSLLAAWWPARQAATLDPAVVLRAE